MKTIILLRGLPASSKSTWAREKINSSDGAFVRVNKDSLRDMLNDSKFSSFNEKFVLKVRDFIVEQALDAGKHVIVDDTNFHPKHKARMDEIAKNHKDVVSVQVKEFDTSPEECIKRDLKRANSVGAKVIWKMYNDYVKPQVEVAKIEVLEQDENLPKAIICDLDGTLALMNGRGPFEYARCTEDLVNEPVYDILKTYYDSRSQYSAPVSGTGSDFSLSPQIILLSGRDGGYESETRDWLRENQVPFNGLFMRSAGDMRKDYVVKRELFDAHIRGKYNVQFVLDDRDQVVKLWRELGLTCLQVADGDF